MKQAVKGLLFGWGERAQKRFDGCKTSSQQLFAAGFAVLGEIEGDGSFVWPASTLDEPIRNEAINQAHGAGMR